MEEKWEAILATTSIFTHLYSSWENKEAPGMKDFESSRYLNRSSSDQFDKWSNHHFLFCAHLKKLIEWWSDWDTHLNHSEWKKKYWKWNKYLIIWINTEVMNYRGESSRSRGIQLIHALEREMNGMDGEGRIEIDHSQVDCMHMISLQRPSSLDQSSLDWPIWCNCWEPMSDQEYPCHLKKCEMHRQNCGN